MKSLYKYFIFAALACNGLVANAQKQTPPEGGAPRNFNLPAKEEFNVENGVQATLVPYGEIPKVTVYCVVQTGNVHELENENGLADITGQLMLEGTETLTAKQISEKVAGMGGAISISVTSNQTILSGSVLSEFGPDLVRLMSDILQHPALPESQIERVKNDFKRNMNLARSQPGTQAAVRFNMALYGGHPYGRDLPTDAQINTYTVASVKDFYKKQFGAQRTNVYAAGKFDVSAMKEAIRSSLTSWQKGPERNIPVAQPSVKKDLIVIDRTGAPQSTIVMGLAIPGASDPDFIRIRVMNSLLGGSFGSRITRNIREDKGYTYSPNSSINSRYKVADWSEQADVTTEHTGNSLIEIVKEINKLQSEAPATEELKGIQNYEAGLFVLRNSTPQGIIGQLNYLDLHSLPETFLTEQVQNIHAVTPQQIQEAAKKHIRTTDMTIVIVGDKKVIEPQIKKFQAETKKTL